MATVCPICNLSTHHAAGCPNDPSYVAPNPLALSPRYLLIVGETYFASSDQALLTELFNAAKHRRLPCELRTLADEEDIRRQLGRLPNADRPVERQS